MAPTGYLFDELYFWHEAGPVQNVAAFMQPAKHWESPETKRRLHSLLAVSGIMDQLTVLKPRHATFQELCRVHTPDYIHSVQRMSDDTTKGLHICGDGATFSPGGYEIAALSAGGAIVALEAVLSGSVANAYALTRPPGHHAERHEGAGFCIFNNVAVAAAHARAVHGIQRIAIVDWDVHHGNGTQHIFEEDDQVLFISLHQDSNYPVCSGYVTETGKGAGEGFTINLPLPPGSGSGAYKHAFETVVVPALHAFQPELILVSSGFDASYMDPLASMMLSSHDYRWMTLQLQQAAAALCRGRLVMLHEGGYSEIYVPFCGLAVLEQLSGIRTKVADPWLHEVENWGYQALQPHQAAVTSQALEVVALLKHKVASLGSGTTSTFDSTAPFSIAATPAAPTPQLPATTSGAAHADLLSLAAAGLPPAAATAAPLLSSVAALPSAATSTATAAVSAPPAGPQPKGLGGGLKAGFLPKRKLASGAVPAGLGSAANQPIADSIRPGIGSAAAGAEEIVSLQGHTGSGSSGAGGARKEVDLATLMQQMMGGLMSAGGGIRGANNGGGPPTGGHVATAGGIGGGSSSNGFGSGGGSRSGGGNGGLSGASLAAGGGAGGGLAAALAAAAGNKGGSGGNGSAGGPPGLGGLMQMATSLANDPNIMQSMGPILQALAGGGRGGGGGLGGGAGGAGGLGEMLSGLLGSMGGAQGNGSGSGGLYGDGQGMPETPKVISLDALDGLLSAEEAALWRSTLEADTKTQIQPPGSGLESNGGSGSLTPTPFEGGTSPPTSLQHSSASGGFSGYGPHVPDHPSDVYLAGLPVKTPVHILNMLPNGSGGLIGH